MHLKHLMKSSPRRTIEEIFGSQNFLWFLVTSLLFGTKLNAANIYPLDYLNTIEVHISQQGLTRITVKEDRINNIFGSAGEYVLEADEEQGQVFIRPLSLVKPISLTLTTEKGHTQDLRLIPKDRIPEAIILQADQQREKDLKNSVISHSEIEYLLYAAQDDRIPLGYQAAPLDFRFVKGPYLLVRDLKGEKLRCLTYGFKNESKSTFNLSEGEIAERLGIKHKIIAMLITTKTLTPGEGTDIHVVTKSSD